MANGNGWTPTQGRILATLSDGLAHGRSELMRCLSDELTSKGTLAVHLHLMRKKLRPIGQDILCEYTRGSYLYRHVRLLASPYRE